MAVEAGLEEQLSRLFSLIQVLMDELGASARELDAAHQSDKPWSFQNTAHERFERSLTALSGLAEGLSSLASQYQAWGNLVAEASALSQSMVQADSYQVVPEHRFHGDQNDQGTVPRTRPSAQGLLPGIP